MLGSHLFITKLTNKTMKKIVNVVCYAVIVVLGIVCLLGIFAVPNDNLPLSDFVYILVSTKVIGVGVGWILVRLIKRWESKGMISEITKLYNEF